MTISAAHSGRISNSLLSRAFRSKLETVGSDPAQGVTALGKNHRDSKGPAAASIGLGCSDDLAEALVRPAMVRQSHRVRSRLCAGCSRLVGSRLNCDQLIGGSRSSVCSVPAPELPDYVLLCTTKSLADFGSTSSR